MANQPPEVAAGVDDADLAGRTVLVTGATRGIGRETALALGRLGARVLVHGRDAEAGAGVVEALADAGADADLLRADFADFGAVRDLAADVRDATGDLDVLVNNAGGYFGEPALAEGVEYTFAVNHLAPFLLTLELLAPLRAGDGGRVVTVASEAHRSGDLPRTDGGDLDREALRAVDDHSGWAAYTRSKLANVLFAFELAGRLDPSTVTATACHPGTVLRSGFTRNMAAPARGLTWLLRRLPERLSGRFGDTPAAAAATPTYLAASREVAGVTGEYFVDCEPADPADPAGDAELRAALWDASLDMTGADPASAPGP